MSITPASGEQLATRPFTSLFDFQGATCVVTGGSMGIGRASAQRFAECGARVVLVDLDERVVEVARAIGEEHGVDAEGHVADVRDSKRLDSIAATIPASTQRIVWANCAGLYPTQRLEDMTDEQWRLVIGVNLDGTFNGSRAAASAARRLGVAGAIVNISSVAGSRAGWPPGIAHYVASKHGVEGLTKALAVELGPDGVRVVCLAPGTVVTDGLVARFGQPGGPDDPYRKMTSRMPIRRPALADDVARVALFVASEAAAMITGCTVPVDGGQLAT